jgi:hypothetical protein
LVIATAPAGEPESKSLPNGTAPTAAPPALPTAGRTNFDSDGDGFYTFDEFKQAVAALYPSYVWPEHYRVDPEHLLDGYADYAEGSLFQVGGEYTIIGIPHMCAWQLTWIDAYRAGDTALMEQSLDQLRTVALNNPMSHQSVRDHLQQVIDAAELGDPALMQQDVTANCQGIAFITPAAATPPA